MGFEVDPNYRQAVQNFAWSGQGSNDPLPIPDPNFSVLVTTIAKHIFDAAGVRSNLEAKAGRSLSLADTCYLLVQDMDREAGSPVTLTKIQQASPVERNIVNHVFRKLSEDFIQVQPDDLKAITLLLSIKTISQIAAGVITPISPELLRIQQMEAELTRIIALRSKYNIDAVPESQKQVLRKLDQQIQEKSELLDALKLSLKPAVT